ncbi:MAG: Gmad2 immunoglobulin-like domain-containing protein [Pseudomonadota bacterium]
MPAPRIALAGLLLTAACMNGETPPVATPGSCDNTDGALSSAAFVIAEEPIAGARVSSGFSVRGCSRTFESTVVWRLLARDGSVLNEGFTTGGGVDGVGPFAFTVPYSVAERQIGHLEVFEEDASDGEGFPPGRTILPVVLQP